MQGLLFNQQVKQRDEKVKKKISSKYDVVGGEIKIGQKVLMKKNHQVGEVKEIKGKKSDSTVRDDSDNRRYRRFDCCCGKINLFTYSRANNLSVV